MFVTTDEYFFWWPVTVHRPSRVNPGELTEEVLKVEFEALGDDELDKITEEIAALPTEKERRARQHDVLLRVVRNWAEVEDADKRSVPFTTERLAAEIRHPSFRTALYLAYAEATAGARRKN